MAAGAFTLYNSGKLNFINSNIDWSAENVTAILLSDSYTPDVAAHSTYGDVSANEIADGDYSPVDMTNKTVTESGGTVTVDADNVSFGDPVSITAKYIVLVHKQDATLDAGDGLIGYMDLDTGGGSVSSTNALFQVNWNPAGLFTVNGS